MKKKILKDYTPAFSLTHLQSLNEKVDKQWYDEVTKKQILNNLEQAKEIEKMVIPAGSLVEILSEGYESDYNKEHPKDLKDRFMYQVQWKGVQFLIDAEMFGDKTPTRPGQDLYKNSRINSTKNTN
jgi:hypothetical protein